MSYLLIIESHSPLASHRLSGLSLALEAAREEKQVKLWLTQDAIQLLQIMDNAQIDACFAHENIDVFADEFAFEQRGISTVSDQLTVASIGQLADHLLDKNAKPIWH